MLSKSTWILSTHVLVVLVCYTLYGVLQEKIMKGTYDNLRFTGSFLLVLFNRLFSILVAIICLWISTIWKKEEGNSLKERLYPTQSLIAYASIAGLNTASTLCQYNSLKYVSFATSSLGKCFKMVPVLLIASFIYHKSHSLKHWVAASTIVLGAATYLFSNTFAGKASTSESTYEAIIGTLLLGFYLFFDGLTSTTQEKLFSKGNNDSDPFGAKSTVFEQMIYISLCSAIISVVGGLFTNQDGHNLGLLLSSRELAGDILVFCLVSSVGLIGLLSTINSYGALFSSTIMTLRQFGSILINYSLFANSARISEFGWLGILWVAAGVFIKMDSRFDEPRKTIHKFDEEKVDSPTSSESRSRVSSEGGRDTYVRVASEEVSMDQVSESLKSKNRSGKLWYQFGIPLLVPIIITIILTPYLARPAAILVKISSPVLPNTIKTGSFGSQILSILASHPVGVNGTESFSCNHSTIPTKKSSSNLRTAFASYPRSGNSMTRTYLERVSGLSTSSVYADEGLLAAFSGEKDTIEENGFFVKTHFPALDHEMDLDADPNYYTRYDQAYHLVRNPLDAINSLWHLQHSVMGDGSYNHNGRVQDIPQFGPEFDEERILFLAERWRDHSDYWEKAPILTKTVRYEDYVKAKVVETMNLVVFLLPEDQLPSLEKVACLLDSGTDTSHQAYKSIREGPSAPPPFGSYNLYTPDTRFKILKIVRRSWCRFGYDRLLAQQEIELETREKRICDEVDWSE